MLKAFYLIAVLTDFSGNETLIKVHQTAYTTKLECMAQRAHYKDVPNHIAYGCMPHHALGPSKATK